MAGKVCNRAHLRFCGDKWYFQYQHYGFPGVTSDTENKYAFLFVAGKGAHEAVPEGYTCPPPSLLPAPLHTGDSSNSPLARDPRAWKSQVTLSSPHVPHQEHWCLREGSVSAWRRAGRDGCGEKLSQGGIRERQCPAMLSTLSSWAAIQLHPRENQHPNCTAFCEASIWEKIPQVGQGDKGFLFLMIPRNFSLR